MLTSSRLWRWKNLWNLMSCMEVRPKISWIVSCDFTQLTLRRLHDISPMSQNWSVRLLGDIWNESCDDVNYDVVKMSHKDITLKTLLSHWHIHVLVTLLIQFLLRLYFSYWIKNIRFVINLTLTHLKYHRCFC